MQGKNQFFFENYQPNKEEKLQFETSKQEIQLVVLENYELKYRKVVKTNASCLEFRNYEHFNAKTKIIAFESSTPPSRKICQLST